MPSDAPPIIQDNLGLLMVGNPESVTSGQISSESQNCPIQEEADVGVGKLCTILKKLVESRVPSYNAKSLQEGDVSIVAPPVCKLPEKLGVPTSSAKLLKSIQKKPQGPKRKTFLSAHSHE
ncbi:hypothetical protein Nepgr_025973 [Nepenthes gracilis]|uniref:Uncharacterized protein n=1 Tax=Nepenthes gracilis TaxID=150966 RepID=A0AAD3T724_NEPGR|nr:hypothetical protein Nepgr_025973 [Nepenthes gracilis]